MLPAVALVGRPNVGKSTLFNRLTATRDALVADYPGFTRDRRYGIGRAAERKFIVIDTGGLAADRQRRDHGARRGAGRRSRSRKPTRSCSSSITRAGSRPKIRESPSGCGATSKPVVIAVNKVRRVLERDRRGGVSPARLGYARRNFGRARSGRRRAAGSCARVVSGRRRRRRRRDAEGPKVAVIGRPNVGKSTLINRLLGENRLITSPEPGTTRDSVHVPMRARRPEVRARRHGRHSPPRARERSRSRSSASCRA